MAWLANATPRPLYPWETVRVPILQEARWASGPVWTGAENLACTWTRSPDRPARSIVATPIELSLLRYLSGAPVVVVMTTFCRESQRYGFLLKFESTGGR